MSRRLDTGMVVRITWGLLAVGAMVVMVSLVRQEVIDLADRSRESAESQGQWSSAGVVGDSEAVVEGGEGSTTAVKVLYDGSDLPRPGDGSKEAMIRLAGIALGGAVAVGFLLSRAFSGMWSGRRTGFKAFSKLVEDGVRRRTAELEVIKEDLQQEASMHCKVELQLNRRIKHLSYLCRLSKLIESEELSIQDVFAETVSLLPTAFEKPSIIRARITFDGIPYETDGFDKTRVGMHCEITAPGGKTGMIEVYVPETAAESGEGIAEDERRLLEDVAELLGRIAELKQVHERLLFFRGLIDGSHDSALVIEPQWGRLMDVNATACESLGYSRDELLTMTIRQLDASLADEQGWQRWLGDLQVSKQAVRESEHVRSDGSTVCVETSLRWTQQGQEHFIIALCRDMTERKAAEQKQAELIAELSHTNERVAAINQELNDFAHVISHDLKAPLGGIRTLADWISADYGDKLGEDGRDQMDQLIGQVTRMHRLIEGVLEYSRAGQVAGEGSPVDLRVVVDDAVELVSAPDHIEISKPEKLPVLRCNETRILQVFENLMSNAIKYMDKPQGRITIGCVEEDDAWRFCVGDNGPGIEKKHFDRVFKIFQTIGKADSFESTGVGLAVVKKIVEMHGGRIWVESEVGQGCRFFFTLAKDKAELGSETAEPVSEAKC